MDKEIMSAVEKLDTRSESAIEDQWLVIREHGIELMPYFKRAYPQMRNAPGRRALIFYATPYARKSEDALQLGLSAMQDRSGHVRDRACGLLAYSLRNDALNFLEAAMNDERAEVRAAAQAARNAIRAQNHHLFADRTNSGSVFWVVNPDDRAQRSIKDTLRNLLTTFRSIR
jgi:hypothetical protein